MENMVQIAMQNVNLAAIMPSLVLCCFGMLLLMISVFSKRGTTTHLCWLSLIAIVITAAVSATAWNHPQQGFAGSVALDNFATFFNMIFLVAAALTILISDGYIRREGYPVGEYYPLILFSTAGAMWMASGTDLLTIFLGLEVLSVSLYVLAGFFRGDRRSNEAGLKYFFLGAFSTGFLLYGIALLYGVSGSTKIADIARHVSEMPAIMGNPMLIVGSMLLLIGFMFKVAAAPFHMWTPDVYQGAPTPVTAFMSTGPKAAGFAALLRVAIIGLTSVQADITSLFWIVAVLTMIAGNFIALHQRNVKRMLAYSSIAHAGYALVGIVAWNQVGLSAIMFYMLVYAFMNIGAFAVLVLVGRKNEENLTLEGLSGLGYKSPFLGAALCIFLFSLMGIPPTAGFTGKFFVFAGAIKAGYIWLAVIGVLNSAVSLYYYLRVIVFMYFREPQEDFSWIKLEVPTMISIVLSIAGVLLLGIVPGPVMELAKLAGF